MSEYKFKIGQPVYVSGGHLSGAAGVYQITQRMPERYGELQYRIKSPIEGHERVVKESELKVI
jgi:hypothetical protein